ncbi:hypothetical protein JTB14_028801 [Gonioctena quinquepunctata]|nr:hypothetical protein JTB14_028801 [Gonioctena quinquepunctata]
MLKDGDINTKLARFLMQQHSTPISTTGNSPAEILMNRKLQKKLSSLHPKVLETSKKQTLEEDAPEVLRQFRAKDPVFERNYENGPKWSPASIQKSLGPVSYRLDTPEGNVLHRHVDQIRRRQEEIDSSPILSDTSNSPRIGNEKQLLDTVDENEGQRDANVSGCIRAHFGWTSYSEQTRSCYQTTKPASIFKGLYKLIFYEVEGRSVMYETVVLLCSSLE